MALSVAENFQLNVTVERNDRCGIIQFLGDSILSEVIWKDRNYLRQLLILLRWADGVCIGTKDDYTFLLNDTHSENERRFEQLKLHICQKIRMYCY